MLQIDFKLVLHVHKSIEYSLVMRLKIFLSKGTVKLKYLLRLIFGFLQCRYYLGILMDKHLLLAVWWFCTLQWGKTLSYKFLILISRPKHRLRHFSAVYSYLLPLMNMEMYYCVLPTVLCNLSEIKSNILLIST